ncbi:hypothetical protein [Vibrio phage pTD1]|uniref:Uncharacterized protein n=1 Tax=Vibrio phage pTD1 TaxID=1938577 RepID=A0A1Q2U2M9_9CAUD|nr:hypothetical protein FDH33_gp009 [Vibrio phage pTD1]BAW98218.1 hypothetical protein [Vibrio phage pTD1]
MSVQIKNLITEGRDYAKGDSINILYSVTGAKGCVTTVYANDQIILESAIVDQNTEYSLGFETSGDVTVYIYVNRGSEVVVKKSLKFKETDPMIIQSQRLFDLGKNLERGNRVLAILSKLAFDEHIQKPLYKGEQRKVFEFTTPRWNHVVEIDFIGREPMITLIMLGRKGEVYRTKAPLRGWGLTPLYFLRQAASIAGQTLLQDLSSEHGFKSILRMSKDPVYGEVIKDAIVVTCNTVTFEPIVRDKKLLEVDEKFCNLYR